MITFCYVVGGKDDYYNQLEKSLRSLDKHLSDYEVLILDFDKKITSSKKINVIHDSEIFPSKKEEYWQNKFYVSQQIKTEYGIYLDCDTILYSDRTIDIINCIKDGIGAVPHFYIQDFNSFNLLFRGNNLKEHYDSSDTFFAGGVFAFKNNDKNKKILQEIYLLHNDYELNQSIGVYDETLMSIVFNKNSAVKLHGAFNHCSANHMPLTAYEEILIGKNPFDENYEKICILHGYSDRQTLGLDFYGQTKKLVQQAWSS